MCNNIICKSAGKQQAKGVATGETGQDKGCNCKGFSKQEKASKDKGFDYKSVGKQQAARASRVGWWRRPYCGVYIGRDDTLSLQ